MFALMQLVGGAAGVAVVHVLYPALDTAAAADVVVPHLADATARHLGPT
jgi:hypothetical protein